MRVPVTGGRLAAQPALAPLALCLRGHMRVYRSGFAAGRADSIWSFGLWTEAPEARGTCRLPGARRP